MYIELLHDPKYVQEADMIFGLICKLHIREAIPRLLDIVEINPDGFKHVFLDHVWRFHDPALRIAVQPFENDPDPQIRASARNCLRRMCPKKDTNTTAPTSSSGRTTASPTK